MKTFKVLFSLLLTLALCLGLLAIPALAEGDEAVVAVVKRADGSTVEKGSLTEAIDAAESGDTVTLMQSVNFAAGLTIGKSILLDLNGNSLSFAASDKQEAAILVDGAEVTIRNGSIKVASEGEDAGFACAVKALNGADVSLDNMTLRYAESEGEMFAFDESSIISAYDGTYSGDPSAFLPKDYQAVLEDGVYVVSPKEAPQPDTVIPVAEPEQPQGGEEDKGGEEDGGDKSPETAGTITNTDGSAATALQYYKSGSSLGGDKSFKVNPEAKKLLVTGTEKELSFTYTAGEEGGTIVIGESANKDTLNALAAGAYKVEVQFEDATSATLDLNVYMSAEFDTTTHVKGSGKDIVVTVSDMPVNVIVSDKNNLSGYKTLSSGTDYTVADGKITLTSTYLDSLGNDEKSVTKYVGFTISYNGEVRAAPYAITILPPPSIDPTSATWKRGTDKTFTVKPDVTGAKIDGTALTTSDYSVSGKTFTLKNSANEKLDYGEHTLTVETSSGPVTAKLTLEPSLGYSSTTGNQHTKGGSKNLIFIASDPVAKVLVDGKEISSDNYTLSSDKKTITLKAAYLNTLGAGKEYTISAVVTANDKEYTVKSAFKIISTGSAGVAPQTGDASPALWYALLLLSCAALAAVLPRLKKQ